MIAADIYEKNNLVGDPKFIKFRSELAKILRRKMVEVGENPPEIIQNNSLINR